MSDYKKLLEKLEAEIEAARQGLEGFAAVTRHEIIARRMRQIYNNKQHIQEVNDYADSVNKTQEGKLHNSE